MKATQEDQRSGAEFEGEHLRREAGKGRSTNHTVMQSLLVIVMVLVVLALLAS